MKRSAETRSIRGLPKFRLVILSVLWLTAMFLYFDRVNISMAAPHMMEELGFSGTAMGLVFSMFSWGYIFGHFAGGIAADRLNIRRWGTIFYTVWCIATALTGACQNVLQLSLARSIFGFSEGAVINPHNKLQNHWFFPKERGIVNGSLMAAAYMGLVFGMPLVGWLINLYGWRQMFYISGAITLLGVLAWWLVIRDYPRDHPWISTEERTAIEGALSRDRVTYDVSADKERHLSFSDAARTLLKNPMFWAIAGANFFMLMIYWTNFSWLPGYLVLERGFSGIKSGNALVAPYFAAAIGALSGGFISDRLGSRSGVIILAGALMMPAMLLLPILSDERLVIAMLCIMLLLNAAAVSICVVLIFDLFPPEIIGVALALGSGVIGGLAGTVGPVVMGRIYDQTHSFAWGFGAMAAGMVISLTLMVFVYFYERRVRQEKATWQAARALQG